MAQRASQTPGVTRIARAAARGLLASVAFAAAAPLLGAQQPSRTTASAPPVTVASSGCAVIEGQVVTPDSVVTSVPAARCGDVRVEIVGAPTSHRSVVNNFVCVVQIAVRVVNASGRPLHAPVEMRMDSVTVFRDRWQRSRWVSGGYVGVAEFDGREMQQPWHFYAAVDSGRVLPPGEPSGARVITLAVNPLTHGFRLWLDVRGVGRAPASQPIDPHDVPPVRPDTVPIPLDRLARALIDSAHLPKVRSARGVYRDRMHGLLLFDVDYGDPHDCPSGCFYDHRVGISFRGRAAWLDGVGPSDPTRFTVQRGDSYLFSRALEDSLAVRFGWRSPYGNLLPFLFESSFAPRAFVRRFVDRLFVDEDQQLSRLVSGSVAVANDPVALTELALVPMRSNALVPNRTAAKRLRSLAPMLVSDPGTPRWTLFVLAQTLDQPEDSSLARALAHHPHASDSPAILTVLAERHPELRAAAVASVHASPRVRQILAKRFAKTNGTTTRAAERALLADPEIRGNEDALLVLANMTLARDDQDLVFGASHLLPEGTFRRWEWPFTPVPLRAKRDGTPAVSNHGSAR